MLRSAYPGKLALDAIGGALGSYFLWKHELTLALLIGGLLLGGAVIVGWKFGDKQRERLSRTGLGRLFLRFGRPLPFGLYAIADLIIPVGLYLHDLRVIAAGILLLVIALAMPHGEASKIRETIGD